MISTQKSFLSAVASAVVLIFTTQAQAAPAPSGTYYFSESFANGGFVGTVTGSFAAVDNGAGGGISGDGTFQQGEMTFLTMEYNGTAPTLGTISLAYTAPNLSAVATTEWFPADKTLGGAFNGFFLQGASATGIQMVWSSGVANGFDYGNTPSLNTGGDPQNGGFCPDTSRTCIYGQIDLFSNANVPLASAQSTTYATVSTVPEPASYLMLLGGIAALGIVARRRAV